MKEEKSKLLILMMRNLKQTTIQMYSNYKLDMRLARFDIFSVFHSLNSTFLFHLSREFFYYNFHIL